MSNVKHVCAKAKLFNECMKIAVEAHHKDYDKGGNPYILHCLAVAEPFDDLLMRSVALCHDVIEDHPEYEVRLSTEFNSCGFSDEFQILKLLTHNPRDSYSEYIQAICGSHAAVLIKMSDIRHNSLITRIKGFSDKDFARIKKYQKSYSILETSKKSHEKVVGCLK